MYKRHMVSRLTTKYDRDNIEIILNSSWRLSFIHLRAKTIGQNTIETYYIECDAYNSNNIRL